MTVIRVTSLPACIRLWEHFREGFEKTERFLRYRLPIDAYRQILFALVKEPRAWVAVCLDDEERPLGFAMAHECTPLFSPERQYEVSVVYAQDNRPETIILLQQEFENFCRAQGVKRYFATTRRDSGASIRCFQSARYGFSRAYTVFSKEIK